MWIIEEYGGGVLERMLPRTSYVPSWLYGEETAFGELVGEVLPSSSDSGMGGTVGLAR